MARQINDVVKGAIKIQGLPENECFISFADLLKRLPSFLSVEIPRSITNVIVGDSPPTEDQKNYLWVRFDKSGNYVGIYVNSKGKWVLAYNFAPNQVIWMFGDSRYIPEGFQLIDTNNSAIPADVATAIMGQYVFGSSTDYFRYFATTYIGN